MANKTIAGLETELKERLRQLEDRVRRLPAVQDFKDLQKPVRWLLIGLFVLVVGSYVWQGCNQMAVENKEAKIEVLDYQLKRLDTLLQTQHLLTLELLKKDSLESLSYEVVKQNNNQQRLYEKQKTDEAIKQMRDAINRGDYQSIINRWWTK